MGYLLVVNGQPWLAAREEDAKIDLRLAKMLPLDPRFLKEQSTQPSERQEFIYRAVLWESEKDINPLQKAWVTFNGSRGSPQREERGGVGRAEMGVARRGQCLLSRRWWDTCLGSFVGAQRR
jgi:hypothetical protein